MSSKTSIILCTFNEAKHIENTLNELEKNIVTHLFSPLPKKQKAIGIVSPHAGFIYSGDVAGAVYSRIEIPDTVVLIGPNHTGYGENVSVMTKGHLKKSPGSTGYFLVSYYLNGFSNFGQD